MSVYSESDHQQAIRNRLVARRGIHAEIPDRVGVYSAFERTAEVYADKAAIVSNDGEEVTYRQLRSLAGRIAGILRCSAGASNVRVAILLSKYSDFIASSLGALKVGSAYVPLDPAFPEDRNRLILSLANVAVVITSRLHVGLAERVSQSNHSILCIEDLHEDYFDDSSDNGSSDIDSYIIFTSGSTGVPKGVVQTHENLLQTAKRFASSLFLHSEDRVSLLASCSVTASVGTIFGSLLSGATLFSFPVLERGLNELANWMGIQGITIYRSVPSLFRQLMKAVPENRLFSSIRIVRLGGDSLYRRDWELFVKHFESGSVLINSYGCSEISMATCCYMDAASRVVEGVLPVGFPLEGIGVAIRQDNGDLIRWSDGSDVFNGRRVAGEIVIESCYLTRGYLRTGEGLPVVVGHHIDGCSADVYDTGDFGTLDVELGLTHLGRRDGQAKLSGFRVELAEIEMCLYAHPEIESAAVIVDIPPHGEREIVSFVKVRAAGEWSSSEIRELLVGKLPTHMIPSEVIVIQDMPYTPNGKIDRDALKRLREQKWRSKSRVASGTVIEMELSKIWSSVLGRDSVGIDDNFFELGGNSLLGMRVLAEVARRFPVQERVSVIFRCPTIRQMGALLEDLVAEKEGGEDRGII